MRCKRCGNPILNGQTFCGRCGFKVESKNNKVIIGVVVGVTVLILTIMGVILGVMLSGNPEEDFYLVRQAINNEDVDYFVSKVRFTNGERIEKDIAEDFLQYLSVHETEKEDFIKELSMGDFANAVNIGSAFSKEYVYGIRPRYVIATSNKDNTVFYYNGEEIGTLDNKYNDLKLGPFLKFDIEIKAKNTKWQESVVESVDFADYDNMQVEIAFKGQDKIRSNLKKNQEYYVSYKYPIGIFSNKTLNDQSQIGTLFVNDRILVKKIISPSVVQAEVSGDGTVGYVKSTYFGSQSVQQPLYYTTKVKGYLNIRISPSTKAASICRIPPDRRVDIISYANDEFSYIRFDRFEGYVSTRYLEPAYTDIAVEPVRGYDSSYMLYDSDSYAYSSSFFEVGYSDWELCVIRNEIFARYGYTFNVSDPVSKKLQEHFNTKSWYIPDYSCHSGNAPRLSDIEKHNMNTILAIEKQRKSPYV